ncbi:ABC transporter ATP-binding protein [Sorangium cellulosum]|nr:ABC transporter ATP-binding protein [Sorangium cellulosum]
MSFAIRCRGLTKRYGDVHALRGLDLDVHTGECFGLLGPNGAGKTTMIEILEGLREPTAGDAEVLHRRWTTHERALRERIGITLQQTSLPERLTAREILSLFRSFYAKGREVNELIRAVQLEDKQDAQYEQLSGGQKQRIAVACALVGNPELLFLDEPTTGLDPHSRRNLWDLVLEFRAHGGTVMLTTHYMDEAERLCDRVGVIDGGVLMALGTPRELIAALGGEVMIGFAVEPSEGVDVAALGALPSARMSRRDADGFSLAVEAPHIALPALLDLLARVGARLTRLSMQRATLDDVFVHLTGRQLRE